MEKLTVQRILETKLIAIVRGAEPEQCLKIAEALYDGGIRLMEITYDQKNPASFQQTADAIAAIARAYEGRMEVGAGTVTTPELAERTAEAGGKFVISPDTNPAVIRRTRELGMVSIPGAMTPTEILTAHGAGADFVKLFPAGILGAAYIKAVRAPISHVRLMAVGGVNAENIPELLRAGVCGAGIGGNLVNRKWVEAGEFGRITETARAMAAAVKSV